MHDAQFEHIEWSPEIPHVSHFCSASFKKHLYNFCLTKTFGLCLLVRNTSPSFRGETILATKPAPGTLDFLGAAPHRQRARPLPTWFGHHTKFEKIPLLSTVSQQSLRGAAKFGVMTTTAWNCTWRLSHDTFFGCFFFDKGVWSDFGVLIFLCLNLLYINMIIPLKGRVLE